LRRDIQQVMDRDAGVLRTADSLKEARERLDELMNVPSGSPSTESWETTNVACVAAVLVEQALRRTETRGSHWREDFPDRDDVHWRVHQTSTLQPDGSLITVDEPVRLEGAL
jgi:L-aspartate oxidase